MAIVSILMSAGTIIMYFFLSLFVPFLTYLIPYYKITKVNLYKKKYSLAINIIVSLVLYRINPSFLIYYLIFPYAMEFSFYLFNKLGKRMQVYNRIVIMSIIPTTLILIYIYINRVEIIRIINLLSQLEEFKKLVESFAHKVIFEKNISQMNDYFQKILSTLNELDCKYEVVDSGLKSISFYQLDEDNEKDYFDYEISLYKNKAIENQALYSIVVNDNNVSFEFGGFVEE